MLPRLLAAAVLLAASGSLAPGLADGACGAAPPPPAAEAGYTTLLFCDDFETVASIDMDADGCAWSGRGPCAAEGRDRFKWFRAGKPLNYEETPREAITVRDGVLTLDGHTAANLALASTYARRGGGFGGFSVARQGAYFEAAVSFETPPQSWLDENEARMSRGKAAGKWRSGWPSFWSMDTCHLYLGGCSPYLELDFFEYLSYGFAGPDSYAGSLHRWLDLALLNKPCGKGAGLPQCHQKEQSNNWSMLTTGFLGHRGIRKNSIVRVPAGTDWSGRFNAVGTLLKRGEGLHFYFNDRAYARNTYAEFPWLTIADQGDYPLILGSRGWPMRVDWVRVWGQAPKP